MCCCSQKRKIREVLSENELSIAQFIAASLRPLAFVPYFQTYYPRLHKIYKCFQCKKQSSKKKLLENDSQKLIENSIEISNSTMPRTDQIFKKSKHEIRQVIEETNRREFEPFIEQGFKPEFINGIDFYTQLFNLQYFAFLMLVFFIQALTYQIILGQDYFKNDKQNLRYIVTSLRIIVLFVLVISYFIKKKVLSKNHEVIHQLAQTQNYRFGFKLNACQIQYFQKNILNPNVSDSFGFQLQNAICKEIQKQMDDFSQEESVQKMFRQFTKTTKQVFQGDNFNEILFCDLSQYNQTLISYLEMRGNCIQKIILMNYSSVINILNKFLEYILQVILMYRLHFQECMLIDFYIKINQKFIFLDQKQMIFIILIMEILIISYTKINFQQKEGFSAALINFNLKRQSNQAKTY